MWGSPRIVNELRQVGIDVTKAQWAVRITGFGPVPRFATAGVRKLAAPPINEYPYSCGSPAEIGNDY
jgi:hypothetical protein